MRLASLAGLYVAVVLSAQIGAQKFIRLLFTHLVAPGASAPIDSFVFLVLALVWSGPHFFDGQLVGKIASSVVVGIPLVVLGRRFVPANRGTIVPA
jgi:hypothetical protein